MNIEEGEFMDFNDIPDPEDWELDEIANFADELPEDWYPEYDDM